MTTMAELRDKFRPREKVVTLVTGGDLLAEHEALSTQLRDAFNRPATSLGDDRGTAPIAERIRQIEAELAETSVQIRLRGIGRNAYRRLVEEHKDPDDDKKAWNEDTFPPALIAACSVDPQLTPAQAVDLGDILTEGQWGELFEAAFLACREVDGVPFNVLASVPTPG